MAGIDDNGSVMEEMMALFTPPGRGRETKSNHKKLELHPYYKRPGKGHNHDCCDACGEGGDLICCDNCPASFHFSCHAPPLEEEDIPMGDWTCLRCYHREQLRLATIGAQINTNLVGLAPSKETGSEATSSNGSTASSEGQVESGNKQQQQHAKGRAARLVQKKQLEAAQKAEREKKIKVYRQKYDVYLKVKPITSSPFDALIAAAQVSNAEQFKLPHELESREALPFSWKWSEERQDDFEAYPKNCFACRKTCRGVPAISCDFCVCVFHLDCLDPPLCEIPKERWMCPNHVEHFLDSNVVSSTSVTQRLKIWQKYARTPVNPDSVRLEFFRKVRTGKLFRNSKTLKVAKPVEARIKVPGYVKHHYKERVKPFPIEQSDQLFQNFATQNQNETDLKKEDLSCEQKDWLLGLISLQTSILKSDEKSESSIRGKKVFRKKKRSPKAKVVPEKKEGLTNGEVGSSDHSDVDLSDAESLSTASECSLGLDEDDAQVLSNSTQDELREYLALHAKAHAGDVDALDETVLKFLAAKKLNDIFSKPIKVNDESEVRARASLIPLNQNSRAQPCLMRYRTLDIGIGGGMALDLSTYGQSCDFVSTRHATIFFDQYARVFELINYSEHGTIVDNIIYTLEQRELPASNPLSKRMSGSVRSTGCSCSKSPASYKGSDQGCEVSAILKHGSYLRFGCLQFVFSIVDYVSEEEKDDTAIRSITVDKKPKPSAEESSKTSVPVEPKEEFADKDDDVIEDDNVDTDKKVDEDVPMAVDEKPATE